MVLMLALCAAVQAAAAPASMKDVTALSWLSGAWVQKSEDGSWAEEYWTPPRGGIMIGGSIMGRGEASTSFEHMRIERQKDGRLAFVAMPNGAVGSAFPLVRHEDQRVEFANPAHDYPQRIRYELKDGQLVATISLIDGSKPHSWTFRRAF